MDGTVIQQINEILNVRKKIVLFLPTIVLDRVSFDFLG